MSGRNLYEQQRADRETYTNAIVESPAQYKIVVAGPGTGKSFTFRKVLENQNGEKLALTFINNLAIDLQKDLSDLAESHTFHGYCKKLLHRISVDGIDTNFYYFPKLPMLVASDAQLLGMDLEKFEDAFHTLVEDERVYFFINRGNYYNAVSHCDAVYRVLKYFQSDNIGLPSFGQIVVDEYQDFNPLEVAFIDELCKASPVLIAGDDDQAIYDFKNASPIHIREKSRHSDFTKFELPYCSRCTKVIVDAVHDVTMNAQTLDKLQNRIDKKYVCFLPDKEQDSESHPKIIHATCSTHTRRAPYISKFIEKEINTISQEEIDQAREKGYPCVLIAGPSYYTKQIYGYLKDKFSNIDFPEEKNEEIDVLDGYRLLLNDQASNLGWRIVLECVDYTDKQGALKRTYEENNLLSETLADEFKNSHLEIVAVLRKIKEGAEIPADEKTKIAECCGRTFDELKEELGVNEEELEQEETREEDTGVSIKFTTINGSKGLSANYVFLVGMNNSTSVNVNGSRRYLAGFPADSGNPTDNEICQLIVGMTRTRKKCYLISNFRFGAVYNIQKSAFIDWIDQSRIESKPVNADYFRNN